MLDSLYYVTVLSNFARGYDKYARTYDKAKVPESTYPKRFFLLRNSEIDIGISKASLLLGRLHLAGDRLLVIETTVLADELQPNLDTGLGRYISRGVVQVKGIYFLSEDKTLRSVSVEEAFAFSLKIHLKTSLNYRFLAPRSVSILPIAKACQAHCPFCFSRTSVSEDIANASLALDRIQEVIIEARARGAERAVITGGGEPTLLKPDQLCGLIRACADVFPKVVLITNGLRLGHMADHALDTELDALIDSGLGVLAVSRHHFDSERNHALMYVATRSENIAKAVRNKKPGTSELRLRWVCVLQKGGIDDADGLRAYLDWAASTGADEVCFKELYVSSSLESVYHDTTANQWSAAHQVPLDLVINHCQAARWDLVGELPWGSPIYEGKHQGRRLRVSAYTEPSVFWELTHGICRSWNLMADGRCLASLEDRNSEVSRSGLRQLSAIS